MNTDLTRASRFLSLILRHQPEVAGLTLDAEGWVQVDVLLKAIKSKHPLTHDQLNDVVQNNDKKRFAFSEDGTRIRANQGHSVEVDLKLPPSTPPDKLYHGTVTGFMDSIMRTGIRKGQRHAVHLSADIATALRVAGRRSGNIVLLPIDAASLSKKQPFYQSANGVWLTEHVPAEFILTPIYP